MPYAQVNCALWIDSLERVDLGLVAISHNDRGLNRQAGIPDPSEEKRNHCCHPVRCQHLGNGNA
jgi:hypothetical protein